MRAGVGVNRVIYGRKIAPRFRVKTATKKMTISDDKMLRSFIAGPYRPAKIASVQNCTVPTH